MISQSQFALISMLVILILMIFFHRNRYLPIQQNHYFHSIMLAQIISCLLDISCSLGISNVEKISVSAATGLILLYFISYCNVVILLFLYVKALCLVDSYKKRPVFLMFYIPIFVTFIIYLLAPANKFVFYFNGNIYMHGRGYVIFSIVTAVYAFMGIVITFARRNVVSKTNRFTVYLVYAVMIIGLIARNGDSVSLIMNVFMMVNILVLYLVRQNPENYLDRETRLFNEDGFEELLHEEFVRKKRMSLFCFDIYNYESFRRAYGSDEVNDVKCQIADFITENYPEAVPFYLSRGRYVVVCCDGRDVTEDAQKMSDRFKKFWDIGNERNRYYKKRGYGVFERNKSKNTSSKVPENNAKVHLKAYINIIPQSIYLKNLQDTKDLVSRSISISDSEASQNIYVMDEKRQKKLERNSDIEKEVEEAIANNTIEVYYQPIYSTETGKINSAEALARLYSDKYGFISPDEFIQIAEQSGDIVQLGTQIFEKVCAFMKKFDIHSCGLEYIEINLSPIQCRDPFLAEQLFEIAKKHEIPSEYINLEITETATEDLELIAAQISQLTEGGITFSMDDYGTGYSNLVNIFNLPFHIIKIDKSIVWAYFDKKNDILEDLIRMFKKRGYFIVAEGVETEEMVGKLTELNCDYLQGFYFSKAIQEEEFEKYVKNFNQKKIKQDNIF